MTRRLYLGLVLHNHQPVGNYGFVIDDVYQHAYLPMLEALERHPGVRAAIHTSGCLFDWIAANRPDYIDRLRALCQRGQIEMMTGGYYEPILPMISDDDKVGQINKLSAYVEDHFCERPTGLWLTERVWEPGLPSPLVRAGAQWTVVDDSHFRMVGLRDDQLDGYYVTEDQGQRVNVFAGSQRLRYTIPWDAVDDVIKDLRSMLQESSSDAPYILLADDGEKFGAWPTTYSHVWEGGWIDRFFSALESNAAWLETITPGEYARRFDARGLVYLPTASYAEMMEWAMPPDAAVEYQHAVHEAAEAKRAAELKFLRGGFWRYFLAKYPESNAMHKRGLRIAEKLAAGSSGAATKDTEPARAARDALWQSQCNCPYWHGVFGGLYLRHIRAATNTNLVRAERLADEAVGRTGLTVSQHDYDFDGRTDVLVQSPEVSVLIHPHAGGMISEFDLRRRDYAALDVLARRREAYHQALLEGSDVPADSEVTNIHGAVRVKESGLASALVFDRYRRGGLQDWILDPASTVQQFAAGAAPTIVEPSGAWDHAEQRTADTAVIVMERSHQGWKLQKEVDVPHTGDTLTIRYTITNVSPDRRSGRFVSEWNIAPPQAPDGDDRIANLVTPGATADLRHEAAMICNVTSFSIQGSAPYALRCTLDAPADVWHFPVDTISSSEGGLERVSQGASISITRPFDLTPNATLRLAFTWRGSTIQAMA